MLATRASFHKYFAPELGIEWFVKIVGVELTEQRRNSEVFDFFSDIASLFNDSFDGPDAMT